MSGWELNLILGALDSLGVALADHDHEWTEGERCIYESAVECVIRANAARGAVGSMRWLDAVREYTKKLTDEQRLVFWHRIQADHCRECGRYKGNNPCHCTNDE